jgi:hypothetical protein
MITVKKAVSTGIYCVGKKEMVKEGQRIQDFELFKLLSDDYGIIYNQHVR